MFSARCFLFVERLCRVLQLPHFSFLKLFCDADVFIFLNKIGEQTELGWGGGHRWQAVFNL